jgi:hypothetical protein
MRSEDGATATDGMFALAMAAGCSARPSLRNRTADPRMPAARRGTFAQTAGPAMTRVPLADLPFWPRYLSRDEAARYLGVSVDVFDDEVREGRWPRGTGRGARGGASPGTGTGLDSAADSWTGPAPVNAGKPLDDPATAAWERRLYGNDRRAAVDRRRLGESPQFSGVIR